MPQEISLEIPVKPYLKQFLLKTVGPTLPVANNHIIGVFILVCLEGKTHPILSEEKQRMLLGTFTEQYTIVMPAYKRFRTGTILRPHRIIYVNRILDGFFDQQLYLHVASRRVSNPGRRYFGRNESIEGFMEQYEIDDQQHISFDALLQRFKRFDTKAPSIGKKNLQVFV